MLDAGSADLMRQWADDGTMPCLGALIRRGRVAPTASVGAFYIGATWMSYATATNAGTHGLYWLDRLVPGSYRIQPVPTTMFTRHPTLCDALGAAGHRVLLLDVPLTAINPALPGVQVIEWRTHDALFGFRTAPPELRDAILASVGEHPSPTVCDRVTRTPEGYRTLADQLVRGAALRSRLARRLLADHPWEFATVVFSESHCAGHQLWHLHDPRHPAHEAAVTAASGDPIRQVYAAIDRAIGEIADAVGPETTIAVAALHNMGCTAGAANLLPEVLVRLGAMARPSATGAPSSASPRARLRGVARSLYHLLPQSLRAGLFRARRDMADRMLGRGTPLAIDPAGSRCFPVPTGAIYGAIRLNLRGREPAGTLEPGDAAEAFCRELTAHLLELVDADTGKPAVDRVMRTTDLCHGAAIGELPDLIVEWNLSRASGATTAGNGKGAVWRVRSDRVGTIEVVNDYGRTGDHRPGGLLVVAGPGISPGEITAPVAALDLAPTFADFFGCTMPGAEGSPVSAVFGAPARAGAVTPSAAAVDTSCARSDGP